MIAFLKALLVDGTLLSPAMLAEMTDFSAVGGGFAFGLGLYRVSTGGGRTVIGFAGGTLGTSSATWYDPDERHLRLDGREPRHRQHQRAGARASAPTSTASPPGRRSRTATRSTIRSVSAAAIAVAATADGLRLAAGDASITLDRALRATTTGNTVFDDGSVLVVGDDAAGAAGDDAANVVRIARDFAAALDRDNQILGLGGDDRLTGGARRRPRSPAAPATTGSRGLAATTT